MAAVESTVHKAGAVSRRRAPVRHGREAVEVRWVCQGTAVELPCPALGPFGAFVATDVLPSPGDRLELEIRLPRRAAFRVAATVRRAVVAGVCGVEVVFDELDGNCRDALQRFAVTRWM